MSVMVKEIFEAFVEAGASREKATAAAAVVPSTDNLATKTDMADLRRDMANMEAGIRQDMTNMEAGIRQDMANMEVRLIKWMVSLQLATLVMIATFIKFL